MTLREKINVFIARLIVASLALVLFGILCYAAINRHSVTDSTAKTGQFTDDEGRTCTFQKVPVISSEDYIPNADNTDWIPNPNKGKVVWVDEEIIPCRR